MDQDKPKKFKFIPKIPKRKTHDDYYFNPVKARKKNEGDDVSNSSSLNDSVLTLKDDPVPKWLKWKDRIVAFDYLVMHNQIKWLKNNIFVDDKNFFFYVKKHNNVKSLLMVREAVRLWMSEYMEQINRYERLYDKDIDKTLRNPIAKFMKLDKESLIEKNNKYLELMDEYKQKFNSVNRKFGVTRNKILKIDSDYNEIMKNIKNKEELFQHFYNMNYTCIIVNY